MILVQNNALDRYFKLDFVLARIKCACGVIGLVRRTPLPFSCKRRYSADTMIYQMSAAVAETIVLLMP